MSICNLRFRAFSLATWLFGCCLLFGMVGTSEASSIKLQMDLSHPLLLDKKKQRIYLKVALTGKNLEKTKRAPVNLAVVLDRSTSMTGIKLRKAKEAAKMVTELLRPDDIFSLVTYDSTVEVLIPATKITAETKRLIHKKIDKIYARGMTALFGGVSKGMSEVRKFLDKKRVNRVILLSDGQANVGPSSPNALGRLGIASARQGISISTIGLGLGYNEDLMTILALKSDGNHGFAKNARDLQKIFQAEVGNLLSVVAQQIDASIKFANGIKPIRVLDNTFKIRGQKLQFRWNQLYSKQHKFVIIELEVPAGSSSSAVEIASIELQYTDMNNNTRYKITQTSSAKRTPYAKLVYKYMHLNLMIYVSESIGNEIARKAMKLRDKGKIKQALKMLQGNAMKLKQMGVKLKSKKLLRFHKENLSNARSIKGHKWNATRKKMRRSLYKRRYQQTW